MNTEVDGLFFFVCLFLARTRASDLVHRAFPPDRERAETGLWERGCLEDLQTKTKDNYYLCYFTLAELKILLLCETDTGRNYLIPQMETKRKYVKTWRKHYVQHMFPSADT